jgi:hypothetical protein
MGKRRLLKKEQAETIHTEKMHNWKKRMMMILEDSQEDWGWGYITAVTRGITRGLRMGVHYSSVYPELDDGSSLLFFAGVILCSVQLIFYLRGFFSPWVTVGLGGMFKPS